MAPGQEANSNNLGKSFHLLYNNGMLSELEEAILMSTHNIQFHHKIRKFPKYFFFWSFRKNFVGTKNEFELAMVNEPSVFEPLRFYCI